jgi:hypothetical protein
MSYNFTVAPNGFIGIGTTQPTSKLQVIGDIKSSGTITASNLIITGDYVFFNTVTSNTDPFIITNQQAATALTVSQVGSGIDYPVAEFYTLSNGIALKIENNGNIGIGVSTPTAKLEVEGDIVCTSIVGNAANVTGLATSAKVDATNAVNITSGTLSAARLPPQFLSTTFAQTVGIGTNTPISATAFEVRGNAVLSAPLALPPVPLLSVNSTVSGSGATRYNGVYSITASPNSFGLINAFDYNESTSWRTDANYNPSYAPPAGGQTTVVGNTRYFGDWIQIKLPVSTYVYSYTIVRGTSASAPVSWNVFGTNNDGATFTLLHSMTMTDDLIVNVSRTYVLKLNAPFTSFRLSIAQIASGTQAIIHGWYIHGDTAIFTGARVAGDLSIGSMIDDPQILLTSNGVGIGTTLPQESLHVGVGGKIRVDDLASGTVPQTLSVSANGTVMVTQSDERLKTSIMPISYGLDDIMRLRPVEFRWKDSDTYGGGKDYGLIAQEVATIFPELVGRDAATDTYTLDYIKLIPVLVNAIQQLRAELRAK